LSADVIECARATGDGKTHSGQLGCTKERVTSDCSTRQPVGDLAAVLGITCCPHKRAHAAARSDPFSAAEQIVGEHDLVTLTEPGFTKIDLGHLDLGGNEVER